MANIPFLHAQRRADRTIAWHWKPSPRLRKAGWTNQLLGTSDAPTGRGKPAIPADVLKRAQDLNRQLAEWDMGVSQLADAPKKKPLRYTWDDLVTAYRASDAFTGTAIAESTRREYNVRLGQLREWALDGRLYVDEIDGDLVGDLKKELVKGSPFRAAAMLRVLRMLLRWAKAEHILSADPTASVKIPTAPSRATMLAWRDVLDMGEIPDVDATGLLALRVAFWSMQRRADLRQLNSFQWREMHGADPRDVPALANTKGEIWGFRVQQQKTGATVDCPMPTFLHAEIEAAFAASQWLFPHSSNPLVAMSGDVIRRRVKPVLVAGGFAHVQLRDMRRSGMSWAKDMGAEKGDVFAISGHPLDGQQRTMADVYMPPNTKASCRAIAAACRTMTMIEARAAGKETGA